MSLQEHEQREEKNIVWGNFGQDRIVENKVRSGLAFILGHFSEPLIPRMVSTADTQNRQKPIKNIEEAMSRFKAGSSWLDSRIAAFGIGQTNPDLIFIDLDDKDFSSPKACKMALTNTLKRIKERLNGGHPTVYQSGRGRHILQPIDCPINLDNVKEFAALVDNPNDKFLQFSGRYLSNGKCDKSNNPGIRSCMIRIPNSVNLKNGAEVQVLQEWDGYRPDYRLLIGNFYAYLVGKEKKNHDSRYRLIESGLDYGAVEWIEKLLLQTRIDDHRKYVRDLILVPYLVLRRGMIDEAQIENIVMQWADKCARLQRLDPSRREFVKEVRSRIYEVKRDRIPPMRLETLKENNLDLYKKLRMSGGD